MRKKDGYSSFAETDVVLLVCGRGLLSNLSLCLLHGPDSGQPFLYGPQSRIQGSHRGVDCHSMLMVISMSYVESREFTYISRIVPPHQLVSITVVYISTNADISVRATLYVGLYTASGGMFHIPLHTHSIIIILRQKRNFFIRNGTYNPHHCYCMSTMLFFFYITAT